MSAPIDTPYEAIRSTDTVIRELNATEFNLERLNLRNYGCEAFGVFAVLAANDAGVAATALSDSALRESARTLQSRHQILRARVAVDERKDRHLFWVEGEKEALKLLSLSIHEVSTVKEGERFVSERCSRDGQASRPLRSWHCGGAFELMALRVKNGSDLFDEGDTRQYYILGALGVHSVCDGVSLMHFVDEWLRVLNDQQAAASTDTKSAEARVTLTRPLQSSVAGTGPFTNIELPKEIVSATDAFLGAFNAWKEAGAKASDVETVASLLSSGKEVEAKLLASCTFSDSGATADQSPPPSKKPRSTSLMTGAPRQLLSVQTAVESLLNTHETRVSIDKDDSEYREVDWKERAEKMSTNYKYTYLSPNQMDALRKASKQQKLSLNAALGAAFHVALRRRHLRARAADGANVDGNALDARNETVAFGVLTPVNMRREASLRTDNGELLMAVEPMMSALPLGPVADKDAYWAFAAIYDARLREYLEKKRYLAAYFASKHKDMSEGGKSVGVTCVSNVGRASMPANGVYSAVQLEARAHWIPMITHGCIPLVLEMVSTNERLCLSLSWETPSISDKDADLFLDDMINIIDTMSKE